MPKCNFLISFYFLHVKVIRQDSEYFNLHGWVTLQLTAHRQRLIFSLLSELYRRKFPVHVKAVFSSFFFYFPKFFWQFRGDSISQCTLSRQMTRTFLWARLFDPCLRKFLSVSDHMRTGKLRDATPSCEMANRSG